MLATQANSDKVTEPIKESNFEIFINIFCSGKNYLFTPLRLFLFEVIAYLNFFLTQWPHKSIRHCLNENKVKSHLWIKYDNNNPITLLLTSILILFHFITSPLASWQAYKLNKYLKGHYYYVKPRQDKETRLMHINFLKLLSLFTCPWNKNSYILLDLQVKNEELQKIQELLKNPDILKGQNDYDDIEKRICSQLLGEFHYCNNEKLEKKYTDLIEAYKNYPLQQSRVLGKLILHNFVDYSDNDEIDQDKYFDANNYKKIKFSSWKDYSDMDQFIKNNQQAISQFTNNTDASNL